MSTAFFLFLPVLESIDVRLLERLPGFNVMEKLKLYLPGVNSRDYRLSLTLPMTKQHDDDCFGQRGAAPPPTDINRSKKKDYQYCGYVPTTMPKIKPAVFAVAVVPLLVIDRKQK